MSTTMPMIAPDGSSGDIPVANASKAIESGFKPAAEMVSPDGRTGYIPRDSVTAAMKSGFKPSPSQVKQPGFWENLGHTFGIGTQEAQAAQQQFAQHPIQTMAENALGPVYQAGKAALGGFMRSTDEAGQAIDALRNGNPAAAGVHAVTALPIVGPALNKMSEEAPATTPGQSYLSQVGSASTPGNVGTALGTAAQVAPMVLGAVDSAAPGRPVIPNPPNPIPPIGSAIRSAAIGDPDVPLMRGLGITVRTKTGLSALQSSGEAAPFDVSLEEAQGARPYGKGAENLEDLQGKLEAARTEINAPLNTALDAVGGRTVQGPDGPTTISDLESQRSQLSAQLRGLQQKDPLAVQTALQKGMGEADLQARYNAVVDAMTPHLDSTGIDSRLIRQQDAQVASIYSRIAGRTTLPEATQPYGFARAGDLAKFGNGSGIDLLAPVKTLGSITRDIAAGRYWSERPTDVNLREGFRLAGPKPDFGIPRPQFTQPPAQLTAGQIELPEPAAPQSGPTMPPAYDATTRAQRLGLLLNAPPIELPGNVYSPTPPTYAGSAASRFGRLLPESTDAQNIPLSEKVDVFPNQLPGAKISPKLAQILKRTGR